MVEMDNPENSNPKAEARAYLAEHQEWMADAVEIVSGDRNADPFVVFPERTMHEQDAARDDASGLILTEDQEARFREVAERFGLGTEQDLPSEADYQVQEGGKPWKIRAQLANTNGSQTKSIIMCGQPGRTLGPDETEYLTAKYGHASSNEYDMAQQIVMAQEGFVASDHVEVLPFGYDIHNNHALVEEQTGQLTKIGELNGVPVMMVRIDNDWEVVVDEASKEEKRVQRNRPDSAAIMRFIANVLTASGDEDSSVGFNTSNTYASRAIDTVRAGLQLGRAFKVGMYGRNTLKTMDPPKLQEKSPISQIPAEFRIIEEKLQQLAQEIEA